MIHWDLLVRINKKLNGWYDFVFIAITVLGLAGFTVAVITPYPAVSAWQHIGHWLGAALLLLGPLCAHWFSAMCLFMDWYLPVCAGPLACGALYLAARYLPPLGAVAGTLPLARLYLPLLLVLAVLLPLVLWLAILAVVWLGRQGPFGDLYFGA